jgi:hypothetical protein
MVVPDVRVLLPQFPETGSVSSKAQGAIRIRAATRSAYSIGKNCPVVISYKRLPTQWLKPE